MKKLHWLFMAICLAVMPALQSCDDNDGYSLGDFTPPLWATVRVTGNAFYLNCDVWGTLWPVNTDIGWYDAVDGQRVITEFLFGFGSQRLHLFRQDVLQTQQLHSMVRPQEDDALYGEDGYVHLELRYNDYDDLTGRRSPGAVSYNLNSLDIPSETKGIKLKLNSEENGEVEVTFDLKTAGSNEKLTTNVDLSNMQLK